MSFKLFKPFISQKFWRKLHCISHKQNKHTHTHTHTLTGQSLLMHAPLTAMPDLEDPHELFKYFPKEQLNLPDSVFRFEVLMPRPSLAAERRAGSRFKKLRWKKSSCSRYSACRAFSKRRYTPRHMQRAQSFLRTQSGRGDSTATSEPGGRSAAALCVRRIPFIAR